MPVTTVRPFFFVHVMKTAGMSFNRYIDANFSPAEIYPGPDDDTGVDYWVIKRLRAAVAERGDEVRLWRGHFPFYVASFVPDAITLSIVREPVSRTVSLLAQRRELEHPDRRIEELYEDPTFFGREIENHQTKVFSMTAADQANAWVKIVELDADRLTAAKSNLERLDLLGCQERFDAFLAGLSARWGWRIEPLARTNVGPETPAVSAAFRRRIATDNALDVELYEHARTICA